MTEHFLNPYHFVSIPSRKKPPEALGDHLPPGHDRYHTDRWSGSIPISLTTATPLLIPDHTTAASRDNAASGPTPALPVRVDADGVPVLAGSAVKGMLRSAYEAVTNSRFGVFADHGLLAIRAKADEHVVKRLRPAIVTNRDPEEATIRWVSSFTHQNKRDVDPNPAVWVPRDMAQRFEDGARIQAWAYLLERSKPGDKKRPFWIWRVATICRDTETLPEPTGSVRTNTLRDPGLRPVRITGWLHRTDSTFPAGSHRFKHDERVVVEEADAPGDVRHDDREIGPKLIGAWQAVIDSFAAAHENESEGDRKKKYGTYVTAPEKWRALKEGRTLYVELDDRGTITGLFPAMIGRRPFDGTPRDSLPVWHRPARSITELSPADRVFGWVREPGAATLRDPNRTPHEDKTAYRGHLRIEPAPARDGDHLGAKAVRDVGNLPLTALNSPKPSQFLFYLGNQNGEPLEYKAKEPKHGYPAGTDATNTRRLRGRKTYLTHTDVVGNTSYWTPPPDADQLDAPRPAVNAGSHRYQEYVAPTVPRENNNDRQNRGENILTRITQWVRPDTTFRFTLRVDNLSTVELGALLWLLTLAPGEYLKIGLGKPLGFGAMQVSAELSDATLYTAQTLRTRYNSLSPDTPHEPEEALLAARQEFISVADTWAGMAKVRAEFLALARGFAGTPVHYPRESASERIPESYKWWVNNDKRQARLPLPELVHETDEHWVPRLPYGPPDDRQSTPPDAKPSHSKAGRSGSQSARRKGGPPGPRR